MVSHAAAGSLPRGLVRGQAAIGSSAWTHYTYLQAAVRLPLKVFRKQMSLGTLTLGASTVSTYPPFRDGDGRIYKSELELRA